MRKGSTQIGKPDEVPNSRDFSSPSFKVTAVGRCKPSSPGATKNKASSLSPRLSFPLSATHVKTSCALREWRKEAQPAFGAAFTVYVITTGQQRLMRSKLHVEQSSSQSLCYCCPDWMQVREQERERRGFFFDSHSKLNLRKDPYGSLSKGILFSDIGLFPRASKCVKSISNCAKLQSDPQAGFEPHCA